MSDDEIASVYATGNFVGLFAPLGSSIGAARVGMRGAKAIATSRKLLCASRVARGLEAAEQVGGGNFRGNPTGIGMAISANLIREFSPESRHGHRGKNP